MAFSNLEEMVKAFQAGQLPEETMEQFKLRGVEPNATVTGSQSAPQPPAPLPQTLPPDIASADVPKSVIPSPPIPESSSYDVDVSTTTPRMEGRPESLPSLQALPEPAALPERKWELEEDETTVLPEATATPAATPPATPTDAPVAPDREAADAALLSSGQDEKERARMLAELEKKRKLQVIPQVVTGIGDAISASASAFGGNAPGGSMQRMIERHDKSLAQGKKDIETSLRNDPNSDISKQYQNLLGEMMQKDPSDTMILGLTANQISEKVPMIEKMMQRRSTEDLKKLALKATKAGPIGKDFSPAQKKFDEEMAKSIVEFNKSGGIKVAKAADKSLQGTINRFKKLKPGLMTRIGSMAPDAARGLMQGEYKSIEQEVRQNVTELLRSTLGAQFTEREGERIFSQTFDPTLHPDVNLRRMEILRTKLKTIADERARAIDWFKAHKTFDGYDLQSDVNWIDDEDYYSTNDWDYDKQSNRRKTKSNIDYTVGS
ncbi:hypothetical protein LCGC14_0836700 [marine sediment metagenome]|uniref:Uncharacterized protein n=1 Tax=marine sediment metagenome TaxID=412755 RepID=A0A0F9RZ08_9ZZZZ